MAFLEGCSGFRIGGLEFGWEKHAWLAGLEGGMDFGVGLGGA
jgi:hypothetical protein